jgi:hypothetical protein
LNVSLQALKAAEQKPFQPWAAFAAWQIAMVIL